MQTNRTNLFVESWLHKSIRREAVHEQKKSLKEAVLRMGSEDVVWPIFCYDDEENDIVLARMSFDDR